MSTQRRTSNKPKRGPRPGENTYELILHSALEQFAQHGYTGTSIRSIARGAGVDPALVHHYFDGKEQLFHRTISGLDVDTEALIERLLALPRELVPAALLHSFLSTYDSPDGQLRFLTLFRATSSVEGVEISRTHYIDGIVSALTHRLKLDHPELRANLITAQLIGLAIARYVFKLDPLAQVATESIIATYVPTFNNYMFGELPESILKSAANEAAEATTAAESDE